MSEKNFNLINTIKAKLPSLAFIDMKNAVLGKKYELSIIIVDKEEIKKLNKQYRNINKPTDILSFPLSNNTGEIYINPHLTKIEAKKFDRNYDNFFAFLVIHGLVHLKGYDHSSTMEDIEIRFRKQFGI
jgi:probable rRNA maturation factor